MAPTVHRLPALITSTLSVPDVNKTASEVLLCVQSLADSHWM